ncbi:AAA family ATPase [Nocardioides sp. CN2-186]|uniref:helix-turn-helix transcriptional regulator n=1 Tax=Nocardioides tweenelious TaxID=3156607 RepID=UPI0032B34DC3
MTQRDDGGHGLLGRDAELTDVQHHLARGGQVVTVLGVAGTGKTSLLSAAARSAAAGGAAVIRVQGRSTETMLGFATLLDLLDSRVARESDTAVLADSIRRRVSGEDEDDAPEALRLRRDVHQWLLALEPSRPLLVVIDDLQWVDPASWSVLSFVANRLDQTRVSFLIASRADTAPPGLDDQTVLDLSALSQTDAVALLERDGPALDPVTRAAIVERAAGNPLALLELARVSGSAVGQGAPLPRAVPAAIESAFAADLPTLPSATRDFLLLIAAGGNDLGVLSQAVGPARSVSELLEPAERAGLVRVSGQRVAFRHPLIESTVYGVASSAQRLEAHAALADLYATDDDRTVWHRAAATDRPDETVAAALMASAERMQKRGAQQEAADAAVRAAELTVDPDLRDSRLLAGVSMSSGIGHVHKIAALADHLRRSSNDRLVRARSTQLHAYALAQTMQPASAQDMLQASLAELIDLDDEAGWAALTVLAWLTYQTCRRHDVLAEWLERYERTTRHGADVHPLNAGARAYIVAALHPLSRPPELLGLLETAPDHLPGRETPHADAAYNMLLGATAWLLDEHATAHQRLIRATDLMQRSGALQSLPQATMMLGQVQFDMGRYDDARRSGRLMIDISEAHGLHFYRAAGRELRARVEAVRGDHQESLREIDSLFAETEPGQTVSLEANLITARGYALTGLREHEAAYQQLRQLFAADGTPVHPHVSYGSLGDLVAAASRVGRVAEVVGLVRAAEEHLGDDPGERMARVLARAKAHTVDDDSAGSLFERAITGAGDTTWPFERANAQLEYGVWLRRQKRPADARHHLRSASQLFARLGAQSWVAAADAELRASGVRLDDDSDSQTARWRELTSQEREIVLLAATGLTNKEIAQTLFLSPRTVGAHLYHAYPKLGVTSRTQLRDVVKQLDVG